eukprot:PhF_6_TR26281/c1_g1_i2/m.37653
MDSNAEIQALRDQLNAQIQVVNVLKGRISNFHQVLNEVKANIVRGSIGALRPGHDGGWGDMEKGLRMHTELTLKWMKQYIDDDGVARPNTNLLTNAKRNTVKNGSGGAAMSPRRIPGGGGNTDTSAGSPNSNSKHHDRAANLAMTLNQVEAEARTKLRAQREEIDYLKKKLEKFHFSSIQHILKNLRGTLIDLREGCFVVRNTMYEFKRYLQREAPTYHCILRVDEIQRLYASKEEALERESKRRQKEHDDLLSTFGKTMEGSPRTGTAILKSMKDLQAKVVALHTEAEKYKSIAETVQMEKDKAFQEVNSAKTVHDELHKEIKSLKSVIGNLKDENERLTQALEAEPQQQQQSENEDLDDSATRFSLTRRASSYRATGGKKKSGIKKKTSNSEQEMVVHGPSPNDASQPSHSLANIWGKTHEQQEGQETDEVEQIHLVTIGYQFSEKLRRRKLGQCVGLWLLKTLERQKVSTDKMRNEVEQRVKSRNFFLAVEEETKKIALDGDDRSVGTFTETEGIPSVATIENVFSSLDNKHAAQSQQGPKGYEDEDLKVAELLKGTPIVETCLPSQQINQPQINELHTEAPAIKTLELKQNTKRRQYVGYLSARPVPVSKGTNIYPDLETVAKYRQNWNMMPKPPLTTKCENDLWFGRSPRPNKLS